MSNSTMDAPHPTARKADRDEHRKKKQRSFITTTSIVFPILFIFFMCITVISASVGAVDTSNGEIQQNRHTPESGNSAIVHTATFYEAKMENLTETSKETTEPKKRKNLRKKHSL